VLHIQSFVVCVCFTACLGLLSVLTRLTFSRNKSGRMHKLPKKSKAVVSYRNRTTLVIASRGLSATVSPPGHCDKQHHSTAAVHDLGCCYAGLEDVRVDLSWSRQDNATTVSDPSPCAIDPRTDPTTNAHCLDLCIHGQTNFRRDLDRHKYPCSTCVHYSSPEISSSPQRPLSCFPLLFFLTIRSADCQLLRYCFANRSLKSVSRETGRLSGERHSSPEQLTCHADYSVADKRILRNTATEWSVSTKSVYAIKQLSFRFDENQFTEKQRNYQEK